MICTRPGCGKQTNNGSGVCIICEKFSSLNDELAATEGGPRKHKPRGEKSAMTLELEEKKEKTMSGVTKSKECSNCGNEYQPTSNVQKFCPACGEARKAAKKAGTRKLPVRKSTQKPAPVKPAAAVKTGRHDLLSTLIAKQSDLKAELTALDTTIETIRKYAA